MRNDKLRGVFEGLGFTKVGSVLSSGNIVFATADDDVPSLEARIQDGLHRELGIAGGTIIRSRAELQELVDSDPFPGLSHSPSSYLTVTFLKHATQRPETPPTPSNPAIQVVGYDDASRALLAVTDTTASKTVDFMSWMERALTRDITTRTWLTVQRILTKLTRS